MKNLQIPKAFSFLRGVNSGFFFAFFFLILISIFSYRNAHLLSDNAHWVSHTHEVSEYIETTLSQMKDMETGQRGYIITGKQEYLAPFIDASQSIEDALEKLKTLTSDNPIQQQNIEKLKKLVNQKLLELKKTIAQRKEKGFEAARGSILTDKGFQLMEQIRDVAADMKGEEARLLEIRNRAATESTESTLSVIIFGGGLAIFILALAIIIINLSERARARAARKIEEHVRIRSGLIDLNAQMVGELSVESLTKNIIERLANFIGAPVGAIYLADESDTLHWSSGYAFPPTDVSNFQFKSGEGLVGQAALQKQPISVSNVPDHYLKVSSSLGHAAPQHIYVFPFIHNETVKGVSEFAVFSPLSEGELEYLKLGLESVAIAVNSAQIRTRVGDLLQKTQVQSEELQTQQEELMSSNEDLKEKTEELQTQQEELRQVNEELEEQRTVLEEQKEELERKNREVEKGRIDLQSKAKALELSGKYKSEFLANMSHELRTPLNSILLLSRSLSENAELNLQPPQIESCEAIYASGADLLNLINDILDISKVEAGKLDLKIAEADISEIAGTLKSLFESQMTAKKLKFNIDISNNCPKKIITDRFRLEQILKNFVSNSLKFTNQGEVRVQFLASSQPTYSIEISVSDTGVGIPKEKRQLIFEAFEQADSTISRKYGGTGLGLTIARDLTGLLEGEIEVESEQGRGSKFTIRLPLSHTQNVGSSGARETVAPREEERLKTVVLQKRTLEDDRDKIEKGDRIILIIEDDSKFARILYRLCKERGFKCLLAEEGELGLADAKEFQPSAIILDLRLPGINGLTVLSNLKDNLRTRHIPIHVMSVEDKSSEVLQMGALGFLSKPVSKAQLDGAFKLIDQTLSTKNRKVLIVEDKKIEREAIQKLIGNGVVKSTGVSTGAEALKLLQTQVFDCMILDLKLADMSGFDLLEKMENDEIAHKPPIIVYTGKELTKDELDKLQKFSESIIIKGVKSEDRFLMR